MNSFATAIIFLSDDLCYILLGKKCLLLTHALQSDSSSCSLAEGLQPYHVFFLQVEVARAKKQLQSMLMMNLESRVIVFEDIGR